MDIDFVVTWVDADNPEWRAEFSKYSRIGKAAGIGTSMARFRDYGLLRYWFRGVEKFAPWVRTIHFVTSGEVPDWLDTANPRIHLVRHSDIIPEQFLPTFNSVVVERYLHRIEGLAEHFVYFNDDFFIIDHVSPERFFRNGLPCDIATFQVNPAWSQWYVRIRNNTRMINRHFDKKSVMEQFADKWFCKDYGWRAVWNHLLRPYGRFVTLRTPHNAQPFLKSTFNEVWNAVGKELTETSANRFRACNDYTPELFRTWQICSGRFEPYNTYRDTRMFPLFIHSGKAVAAVGEQKYSLVCLNDHRFIINYRKVISRLRDALEQILPEKSSWEKDYAQDTR